MRFWRTLTALIAAVLCGFHLRSVSLGLLTFVAVRFLILVLEIAADKYRFALDFDQHAGPFREMFGPYGQQILTKAQSNPRIRRCLAEVFSAHRKTVEDSVAQLKLMNELSKAGMKAIDKEDEAMDLALAYGKHRLEKDDF